MKTLIALSLVLGVSSAYAANTAMSKKATTVTAESQALGTDADVEVTRKIRDRLTSDDSLSASAQNITIVTKDNMVMIKGMVDKQDEIRRVRDIATEFAGSRTIKSDLKINKL